MRWILLALFLFLLPAGAESTAPEWNQKPKVGWVHQLGVSLAVPGKRKVSCDPDGALHVETDDYLVQFFVYADEAVAKAKVSSLATESEAEKTFAGLKFGEPQKFPQPKGGSAFLQEGAVNGFRFLLARVTKGKYHVVVYSIMSTGDAQDATLALMSTLKFPER